MARDDGADLRGAVWFGIRGPDDDRRAFIFDLIVEEAHRGRGHGRQIMLLLEPEIRARGLNRIGLHVFGFNSPAIALYRSLGYETTDLTMEKKL